MSIQRCQIGVLRAGRWLANGCGRRVKHALTHPSFDQHVEYVCGIHKNMMVRDGWRLVEQENPT